MSKRKVIFRGETFKTRSELLNKYKIDPSQLSRVKKREKLDFDNTVEYIVSKREQMRFNREQRKAVVSKKKRRVPFKFNCTYDGIEFTSRNKLAKYLKIDVSTLISHEVNGESLEESIRKIKNSGYGKSHTIFNKEYRHITDIAREFNIKTYMLHNYINDNKDSGLSKDELIENFLHKRGYVKSIPNKEVIKKIQESRHTVEVNGEKFPSKKEACRKYGISYSSTISRMKRKKVSFEESFNHFIKNGEHINDKEGV